MTLFQQLIAKQKADKLKAQIRLEKRRGYARTGRERAKARAIAEGGLEDLPIETQAAMSEQTVETPEPATEPKPVDATVEELVGRLTNIKERIFRLHAVYAVSLSLDAAIEANRYLTLFQDLAAQLEAKDQDALAALILGHETMLLSPPVPVKRTIPIETQRWCEMRWEAQQSPTRSTPKRPADSIGDGLGWML